jgi:hypothetical protein
VEAETVAGKRELRLLIAFVRIRRFPGMSGKPPEPKREEAPLGIADILARIGALKDSAIQTWDYFGGELPKRLWLTLRRYFSCMHIKVHRLNIQVGMTDPAETGIAYGAACTVAGALPVSIPVRLSPDFVTGKTSLDYRISLRIVPIQLLFEIVRTFFALKLWAVIRINRKIWSPIMSTRRHHV